MAKKKEYVSVAKTTLIGVTSRASVCIEDKRGNKNFYTMEYHEERQIPDLPEVDILKEREILWDVCNMEVDGQIEEVIKLYKK